MPNYPGSIYSPKIKENKNGVVYDEDKTTVAFAQDFNEPGAEIVAVETDLLSRNKVAGKIPTFANFDTNPADPANMTDGDFTTESGEGIKALAAPGAIGNIIFDMGAIYPVLIIAKINVHRVSGDGSVTVAVDLSTDGINFYSSGLTIISGRTVDQYYPAHSTFLSAQYFQFRITSVSTTTPSVYHIKVAEVMAIKLIP